MKNNTKGAAGTRNGLGAFFVYLVILAAIGALGFGAWMFKNTMERNKGDEVIIAQQNKEITTKLATVISESGTGSVARRQENGEKIAGDEPATKAGESTLGTPAAGESTPGTPAASTTDQAGTASTINTPGTASAAQSQPEDDSLVMLDIEGISCVGILRIGDKMAFAVADISSEADDCYLPYYISGTPASGDLLIRGVGSEAQFGAIKDVEPGEKVSFTDATGIRYIYETVGVSKIEMSRVKDAIAAGSAGTNSTATNGIIVSSESMRESNEIDLQLYYDEGDRYRVVMDCKAKRGDY